MTNNKEPAEPEHGITLLTQLRKTMPIRALAYYEHLIIAEWQATQLLALLEQRSPGVSLDWLSGGFDNLDVVMVPRWRLETTGWAASGFSKWRDGRWLIGINKAQPQARRRFTLCHEFKHILDGNRNKVTHAGLTDTQRERIADYFAACYLMPKALVRQAWTHGLQDVEALAGLFKVSVPAMETRLKYLQYIDSEPDRAVKTYFRRHTDKLRRVVNGPGLVTGRHQRDEEQQDGFGVRADAA